MKQRKLATSLAFAAVIAIGGAIGVLSANGGETPYSRVAPQASFTPGYTVAPPGPAATALATFTPGPEPTATTGAAPTEHLPVVRFTSATAAGSSVVLLPVEVPPTSEYGVGLSGRRTLEGRGMVFYYPDGKGNSGFWMRNTHIDLDIAFVDTSLTVISIIRMKADTETVHKPGTPYLAAIEAPAGYYEAWGVGVGARVEFLFDIANAVRR